MGFEDYLSCDADVSISGFMTDDDILYAVQKKRLYIAEMDVNDIDFKAEDECLKYNKTKLNDLWFKL